MFNNIGSRTGNHQFAWITGHPGGTDADFCRVADALNLHHIVNPILNDTGRQIRERLQGFGEQDHLFGILRVNHGVTQRAALRGTAVAAGIAIFIAAGDRQKSDINGNFALLNQIHSSAVGVNLYGFVHQSV